MKEVKLVINLDPDFGPLDGRYGILKHKSFTFPGGEPHVDVDITGGLSESGVNKFEEIIITHRVNSFNDLGMVIACVYAVRRYTEKVSLIMPYFPGARQDRLTKDGEVLTVRMYADIINSLSLYSVVVVDPHSDVVAALVNNVSVISPRIFAKDVLEHMMSISGEDGRRLMKDMYLVAPDAGSAKKLKEIAGHLRKYGLPFYKVLQCGKRRDTKTGKLSGFEVYADDLEGRTCLILDDICDGGGTFLGLAHELEQKGAGELLLGVSHGIFSKGLDRLLKKYSIIFTTDSISDKHLDTEGVVILPLS